MNTLHQQQLAAIFYELPAAASAAFTALLCTGEQATAPAATLHCSDFSTDFK
jgi:hypothetical protein